MIIPAALRMPPPPEGWPPAPCERWQEVHPAHGWVGKKSGRIYWCGPRARAWARTLMGEPDGLEKVDRTGGPDE